MNIISIDLTKITNGKQLRKLCRDNGVKGLSNELIFNSYKNKKIEKIYLDKDSLTVLATVKDNVITLTNDLFDIFRSTIPLEFTVNEVKVNAINSILNSLEKNSAENKNFGDLTLDYVLDKISLTGLSSLNEGEKSFLDNISNKKQ